jgi:hypothetical protein
LTSKKAVQFHGIICSWLLLNHHSRPYARDIKKYIKKKPTMSMAMAFGQRPGFNGNGGFMGARNFLDFITGVSLPYRVSLKPKKK